MNTTMTAAELAALLGISDRAVRDLAKAGHVVSAGRGKYGTSRLRSLAVSPTRGIRQQHDAKEKPQPGGIGGGEWAGAFPGETQ